MHQPYTPWFAGGTRSTVSSQHRPFVQHASYEIPGQIFVPGNMGGTLVLFIYLAFSSMYASMEQTEIYLYIGQRNKVPAVNFDPVISQDIYWIG
jgi:hypothetical protein